MRAAAETGHLLAAPRVGSGARPQAHETSCRLLMTFIPIVWRRLGSACLPRLRPTLD
jgi:hypothetical protein